MSTLIRSIPAGALLAAALFLAIDIACSITNRWRHTRRHVRAMRRHREAMAAHRRANERLYRGDHIGYQPAHRNVRRPRKAAR